MVLIDYQNVEVSQWDGRKILSQVDFSVSEGEFVYVIGRVGAGKSSLLKTIYQELDIEEATRAEVLGTDMTTIRRRDVPALRRQMGIVFQDFQLLGDRSVEDNLRFVLEATGWPKAESRERIAEVLAQAGMEGKAASMPHELSGGEQQRIAIARALLNSPKLIIADEPTGNLDHETATGIMRLLRSIADKGTAVVMSTHNISLIEDFPGTVYECRDGRLIRP